ncbi:unnamed protein product [Litomosoides sigmodontis]|uniref:Uncharacterized protein n=1 Tax=Litomosoides sigmodontis TaxID=42156 RepID=A0A3P7JSH8_LITSI|nr:unnamed protein product [Litomosoides sigmodontis]
MAFLFDDEDISISGVEEHLTATGEWIPVFCHRIAHFVLLTQVRNDAVNFCLIKTNVHNEHRKMLAVQVTRD